MKIAVYSGSFNPMHIGHIAVVRYLLDHGGFDMVYLVVSPHNPFKDGSIKDNAAERYANAVAAIKRAGLDRRVKVDDLEFHRPSPSYTIDTLDTFQQREPHNTFTLIMGGDNIAGILRWKEGGRILLQYGIAVYPREGNGEAEQINALTQQNPAYKILLFHDAPMLTVSSTQIREMISREQDVTHLLA